MGRPIAYPEWMFLKALPTYENESITIKQLAYIVDCSESLTSRRVNSLAEKEMVKPGKPTKMGAVTWYRINARPELNLPQIMGADGVYRDIKTWVKANIEGADNPGPVGRPIVLAILETWINACDDTVKFSEGNQSERAKLLGYRAGLKDVMRTIDSMLNDPFLNGDTELVSMAEDAIRGVSADIDLDKVIDKCNALRQL